MIDRHEDEVDRVLQALGAAEPAAGLEARVLARLAQTPEPARSARWFWLGAGLALAGGLALVFTVATPHSVTPPPAPAIAAVHPALDTAPAPRIALVPLTRVPLHHLPQTHEAAIVQPAPAIEHPSRGLADLPSSPVPPLPPTQQEKVLVQVARGTSPGPSEFALLNPVVRERLAQQSAAEFKQFFPPPTPQEIYLAEHTPN